MENNICRLELISDHDNCHFVYSWSIISPHMFSSGRFVCVNDNLVGMMASYQLPFWRNAPNCSFHEGAPVFAKWWISLASYIFHKRHRLHFYHHQRSTFEEIHGHYLGMGAGSQLWDRFVLWFKSWHEFSHQMTSFGSKSYISWCSIGNASIQL